MLSTWGDSSSPAATPAELGTPKGEPIPLCPLPLRHTAGWIPSASLWLVMAALVALLLFVEHGEIVGIGFLAVLVSITVYGLSPLVERRRRSALQTFERGVCFWGWGKMHAFGYDDIETLSVKQREILFDGDVSGLLVTVELKSRRRRVRFRGYVQVDSESFALRSRLFDIVRGRGARIALCLERGYRIHGRGWTLDREGLRGESGEVTPLTRVVCSGMSGGRVRLWRAGEERPFIDIPDASVDAVPLLLLVESHVAETSSMLPAPGPLGRFLFTRRPKRAPIIVLGVIGALGLAAGVMLHLTEDHPIGMITMGCGLLTIIGTRLGMRVRLDVYALGLRCFGAFGHRELRYDNLASLSHKKIRTDAYGRYFATLHALVFEPIPGAGQRISFTTDSRGTDTEIEALCAMLVESIQARLERGGAVRSGGVDDHAALHPGRVREAGSSSSVEQTSEPASSPSAS